MQNKKPQYLETLYFKQHSEPMEFKNLFPDWNPDLWNVSIELLKSSYIIHLGPNIRLRHFNLKIEKCFIDKNLFWIFKLKYFSSIPFSFETSSPEDRKF